VPLLATAEEAAPDPLAALAKEVAASGAPGRALAPLAPQLEGPSALSAPVAAGSGCGGAGSTRGGSPGAGGPDLLSAAAADLRRVQLPL
jgi:hypothetical protein